MAEVTSPTLAGPRAGYLAQPPGDDARPAVFVIHEGKLRRARSDDQGRAQRLGGALAANTIEHEVKLYPEPGHGFLNTQPLPPVLSVVAKVMGMHLGYHAASAEDASARIGSFFDAHLKR